MNCSHMRRRRRMNSCRFFWFPFSNYFLLSLFVLSVVLMWRGSAQTTPMPTSPPGKNSIIAYNTGSDSGYVFRFTGDTRDSLYRYSIPNSGTLHGIKAKGCDNSWFFPSNHGGPVAELPNSGEGKYPWDPTTNFLLLASSRQADTVVTKWKMTNNATNSFGVYQYKLHISGRTLVIRVKEESAARTVAFTLDSCAGASPLMIVKIPNLPLFNLLYCNKSVTSLFFDWEVTKCSRYDRPDAVSHPGHFAPSLTYIRTCQPDWKRTPLEETIYLTVSPDLLGALPNLVLPSDPAPNVETAMAKTVMFYSPPYPWLQTLGDHGNPYSYRLLDSMKRSGVKDLAVILQWYQFYGIDSKLPDIIDSAGNPASFPHGWDASCGGGVASDPRNGKAMMSALRSHIVDTLGYGFALHQNYFEYFPSSPWIRKQPRPHGFCIEFPDKTWATNIRYCSETSEVYKPSITAYVAGYWREMIKGKGYDPTWTYLDVTTATNALEWADFDNSSPGAGSSLFTLQRYRDLARVFRNTGPVMGEGGWQFLYVGYFDDFEGRIQTADLRTRACNLPLLVDFDLYKMHGKCAQHGPGHGDVFFGLEKPYIMNPDQILTYIATELAYGRAGLITKRHPGIHDNTELQALLEKTHVCPMQKAYAKAHPTSIRYGDQFQTAEDYIGDHSDYADITSVRGGFMGRVKIEYDNGVVVCVNRSSREWTPGPIGSSGGWFTYNSTSHGLNAGTVTDNTFTLKANNGWACYNPFAPAITTQPSPRTVTVGDTSTFAAVATGSAPLTYQWQKNNSNIAGATRASYTTPATVIGDNGSAYRCIVTNGFASVSSKAATLTVNSLNANSPY